MVCGDLVNTPISISYSIIRPEPCAISGSVQNVRNGNVSYCGGTLQDVWVFTDACGRTISASRLITLLPAPPATFTSLPPNVTVSCEDVYNVNTVLNYTNGQSGFAPSREVFLLLKADHLIRVVVQYFMPWTFTDLCNRSITHTMTMTIEPAPDPDFVDPPARPGSGLWRGQWSSTLYPCVQWWTGPCGVNINAPLVSVTQNGVLYTTNGSIHTHVQGRYSRIYKDIYHHCT